MIEVKEFTAAAVSISGLDYVSQMLLIVFITAPFIIGVFYTIFSEKDFSMSAFTVILVISLSIWSIFFLFSIKQQKENTFTRYTEQIKENKRTFDAINTWEKETGHQIINIETRIVDEGFFECNCRESYRVFYKVTD